MTVTQQKANYAFIDGINLHLTFKNVGWELDYSKLRTYLSKRHNVIVAYYFLGFMRENQKIYDGLTSYGYTLKSRDISKKLIDEKGCPYCGKCISPEHVKTKCDSDADLVLHVMDNFNKFDKAIIITSDGDFDNLIRKLLQEDKLKTILAPCTKGCSQLLKNASLGRIEFLDNFKNELEKF
jgi:uncharacterized LabA/DUF88 family protein